MKPFLKKHTLKAVILFSFLFCFELKSQTDPLPSWEDNTIKNSIVEYVTKVTDTESAGYIPVEDRIATFDNDGTLWTEMPLPFELYFSFDVMKMMIEENPQLKNQQPYKAFHENDKEFLSKKSTILEILLVTHSGISKEKFDSISKNFIENFENPVLKKTPGELTYAPMKELMNYLRSNDFRVYICSGGTSDFMRTFSKELYEVPVENVIGTTLKSEFEIINGKGEVINEKEINLINDQSGKPVGINYHIGKIPVFAAGNVRSEGDIEMLTYSQSSPYPNFQLLVNHDDAEREFSYTEKDNGSLNAAKERGFTVISIKNDWKKIF